MTFASRPALLDRVFGIKRVVLLRLTNWLVKYAFYPSPRNFHPGSAARHGHRHLIARPERDGYVQARGL